MVRIRKLKERSDVIATCLSCMLCNQFLKDATKIIECFHTFCRKCIYDKIREENLECCPVCKVDLGNNPFDKLRPDFLLQDIRNTTFPLGKEKKARELLPSALFRASRTMASGSSFSIEKPIKKEEEASGSKSLIKSNVQGSESDDAKLELFMKAKNKKIKREAEFEDHDEEISDHYVSSDIEEDNNLPIGYPREEPVFGTQSILPQALFYDDVNKPPIEQLSFSLIASENQEGDAPLPQIAARYVRMKDGSVSVSYIRRFIAKKLGLQSEDEVEIICLGQPVPPTLPTDDLVNLWQTRAATGHTLTANVGPSEDDCLKVLHYGRKVPSP